MDLPKKNEIIDLEITALSHEGSGIGRYNGVVVFVPVAVPGDVLKVKIVRVLKNRMYGIVSEVMTPSKNRVENDCPVFPMCGGCTLRHFSYTAELEEKAGFLKDNLERIGKVSPELESAVASPAALRYRNKAQYPVQNIDGKTKVGFYAARSHRLIPLDDCLLQPEEFSRVSNLLCSYMDRENITAYDESENRGLVRHLCIRSAETSDEIMVTVVINGKELPNWESFLENLKRDVPSLKTLTINHNTQKTNVILGKKETVLYGDGIITDKMLGVELEISSRSFYQVNRSAAELLYKKALEYANPSKDEVVLDLYCGIGAIGLTMADKAKEIIGVEIIEDAVINARKNSKINGIDNARFICADAGEAAIQLAKEDTRPDIIILDPPRKGVDAKTIEAISLMSPSRVVYVSCDTATLARDVKLLEEEGFRTDKAVAVDLFPRTAHIESVVLLNKIK